MNEQSQDARYAPPRSHVEDVSPADSGLPGQLASRGKRFWAAMIDGGIGICVLWLLARFTPLNAWGGAAKGLWTPQFAPAAWGFLLFLILQGYLLATRGQTIGKTLFKIRIARPDGSLPSIGRVIGLRYGIQALASVIPAAAQIFALVDLTLIFRASRRCLHDQIADTVVLQA
jgi:uncharacterized RDD family membrane protein YckC